MPSQWLSPQVWVDCLGRRWDKDYTPANDVIASKLLPDGFKEVTALTDRDSIRKFSRSDREKMPGMTDCNGPKFHARPLDDWPKSPFVCLEPERVGLWRAVGLLVA